MLQMKLFRKRPLTPEYLSDLPTVQFANPNLLGVRFDAAGPGLATVQQQAAKLRLAPVSLGVEAFVAFLEAADQTGLFITDVSFSPPLEADEAEHLAHLIEGVQQGRGMSTLTAYLVEIIGESSSIVKAVTFLVPDAPRHSKVTVFNNGIIFVNDDDPAINRIDWAVSQVADSRPGYYPT